MRQYLTGGRAHYGLPTGDKISRIVSRLEIETWDFVFKYSATYLLDSLLMVLHLTLLCLDIEDTRKTTSDRGKADMSHIDMGESVRCSHLDSSNQVCISLKEKTKLLRGKIVLR